jgi:hypothetical protein
MTYQMLAATAPETVAQLGCVRPPERNIRSGFIERTGNGAKSGLESIF